MQKHRRVTLALKVLQVRRPDASKQARQLMADLAEGKFHKGFFGSFEAFK